jgi:hypothetical protein
MGFFKKVFGGKENITSVMLSTQNNIFGIFSVVHPTDAQKMKASVYLCIAGMAILNDPNLGGGRLRYAIDNLVNETRELTKSLMMRVGELANNAEQLEKIISDFPADMKITGSTTVNGLAAFEAMYFSMAQDLMNDILTHNKGPFGTPGYAAIVVTDGIFGEGKAKDKILEMSMELINFTKELSEAI